MFTICSEIPLPGFCRYRGIAFDGCQYYLTFRCACKIAVLDCDFRLIELVKTRRIYTAICYDPKRDCFWAASDACRSTLFKLDHCLREIDRLAVCLENHSLFTGVSFCCDTGRLLVAAGNSLVEVDPERDTVCLLREEGKHALILSAICLPPYIMFCVLRGCKPYIVLLTHTGALLAEEQIPSVGAVDAILQDPCRPNSCGLLLLTDKHGCYPYLLKATLEEQICSKLRPCSQELRCMHRTPCRPCRQSACDDVLESIALQEAAIAHILNAEGEKMQKSTEISTSISELLEVNASVQETLWYAAFLERVLSDKLNTLQGMCCCVPAPWCGFWDCGDSPWQWGIE